LFANREQRTNYYLCCMRQHNGMRPQDIIILLKLVCLKGSSWQYRDLAADLFMPLSEVSGSLKRSAKAGLYNAPARSVNRQSLMEFLQYGFRYVFPAEPATLVTGLPTAHSHPYYKKFFSSELPYVWPDLEGHTRGLSIEPLHPNVPKAAAKDDLLYKLLSSLDILRVGRAREITMVLREMKKILL